MLSFKTNEMYMLTFKNSEMYKVKSWSVKLTSLVY